MLGSLPALLNMARTVPTKPGLTTIRIAVSALATTSRL